jgi:S-adenosyl-l-methionine hydroxide adenosyltransferase
MHQPVIYLTDCTDTNAVARLSTRTATLLGGPVQILPLDGPRPDLMAGLTLVDIVASTHLTGGQQPTCTVLINIAPRDDGSANGTPFCYFETEGSLIVTTANPEVLAFGRRYLGISETLVTDVQEVMNAAAAWSSFSDSQIATIANSQFRSLWFMPLLARWVREGQSVPARSQFVPETLDRGVVAVVDNFGNCKTNSLPADVNFADGAYLKVCSPRGRKEVRCYQRLADVPHREAGLIIGSSGQGLLELVINGASAAAEFELEPGDSVFNS